MKEPMMMPEAVAFGKALNVAKNFRLQAAKEERAISSDEWQEAYVPALCLCIESAQIENFPEHPTVDTWPFSPKAASVDLTTLILTEVQKIYFGEQEETNPNA